MTERKQTNTIESCLVFSAPEGKKHEGGLRTGGHCRKSNNDNPLVTVITVVFNGKKHIEETILSVVNQTYKNIEYIVVDGGSTDGTLEIIRKYEHVIDYWVSEKDKGISDALNKGIRLSQGDIVGMIHADDWYEADAVEECVTAFKESKPDIVCAKLQYWNDTEKDYIFSSAPNLLAKEMTINHPTVFVSKETYLKWGLFKVDYKYAMDYELMLRFKMNGARFVSLGRVLANMRFEGVSDKNWRKALAECRDAKLDYFSFLSVNRYYYFQIFRGGISRALAAWNLKCVLTGYRKYFSILKKLV